jgi:hypothetical protein
MVVGGEGFESEWSKRKWEVEREHTVQYRGRTGVPARGLASRRREAGVKKG